MVAETTISGALTVDWVLQNLDGSVPYQTFRAILDSKTYEITFQWNERNQYWTLAIGDVGDDPIVKWKVTAGSRPLQVYGYNTDLPQGYLSIFSLLNSRNRVDIDSLGEGKMHHMVFFKTQ